MLASRMGDQHRRTHLRLVLCAVGFYATTFPRWLLQRLPAPTSAWLCLAHIPAAAAVTVVRLIVMHLAYHKSLAATASCVLQAPQQPQAGAWPQHEGL
jgi:hypothetical protein